MKKIFLKSITILMIISLTAGMFTFGSSAAEAHEHCVCGGEVNVGDHTAHEKITFTEWTETTSMPTATGNYVLTADVTISEHWRIENNINIVLCLNGHTLKYEGDTNQSVIVALGKFTLCDCKGTGKITGGKGEGTGNTTNLCGGGIQTYDVFDMYGGIITENSAIYGGGVHLNSKSATFNMYGGSITENSANDGGGIGMYGSGSINIYGGSITANSASGNGGGIFLNYGNSAIARNINIRGGIITGNIASENGGAIWSIDTQPTNMAISGNPVIKSNLCGSNASNLYVAANVKINVGTMTEGADVGISLASDYSGDFAVGGIQYVGAFFADSPAMAIAASNDGLKLVTASADYAPNGVKSVQITPEGRLLITLFDGTVLDGGTVPTSLGEKGDKGDTGAQGIQGEKGDKGDTGAQGVQGIQGEKGDKGDTGAQGVQGIQGEKGDKGDTGAQGVQGDKGDVGEIGAAGADGKDGIDGKNGHDGADGRDGLVLVLVLMAITIVASNAGWIVMIVLKKKSK